MKTENPGALAKTSSGAVASSCVMSSNNMMAALRSPCDVFMSTSFACAVDEGEAARAVDAASAAATAAAAPYSSMSRRVGADRPGDVLMEFRSIALVLLETFSAPFADHERKRLGLFAKNIVISANGPSVAARTRYRLCRFDDVQLLDFAGPLQTFVTAGERRRAAGGKGFAATATFDYRVRLVSRGGGAVRTSSGVVVMTDPLPTQLDETASVIGRGRLRR